MPVKILTQTRRRLNAADKHLHLSSGTLYLVDNPAVAICKRLPLKARATVDLTANPADSAASRWTASEARVATWANGMVVRELIVDIDDDAQRLAYAVFGGRTTHHNSSMQVFTDADGSRLVWITDLLPNELAGFVTGLVEQGAAVIKDTLEAGPA